MFTVKHVIMADSDHECDKTTPKKPKILKKVYKQKFRAEWMSDPAFKSWLVAPKSANNDPSCKFCTKKISCTKTALQRHRESAQHKQAFIIASKQVRIDVSLQVNNNSYKETTAVQLASFYRGTQSTTNHKSIPTRVAEIKSTSEY